MCEFMSACDDVWDDVHSVLFLQVWVAPRLSGASL
jgi:hypothetical protein